MLSNKTVVLVVEDMDAIRKITVQQVKEFGAKEVYQASNGSEALRVLNNHNVDLILSDWNMPVMTGIEFLKRVKASPAWQRLPFVMITAEAERDRVTEAIRQGVSEIVIKPFSPAMLRSRIERARNRPARIPSEIQIPGVTQHQEVEIPIDIAPVDDKSLKDGVILLVDDTPDNLRLLADLLKNKYKIKLANNGQKALDICRSESPPDLVLLDIMMPGISGYEVLKELRSQSNTEHIPVMFVTAMNEADSELKGMELGAIDYITKPINPHLLQLRVRNMMMQVQRIWEAQSSVDDMIALAEARNEAEQMVRHDLKGPLSGIIASIQQIALQPRNLDVITEHSNGIDFLAHQLLNMINLSAELYKIEQGIYQLDATEIDTAKLLKDVITVCDNSFAAKRLTCNLIVPSGSSDKSLFSLGDPLLLYSVFFNLVKNAFEAAPEKSAVRASISRDDKTIKIILSNDGSVPQNIRSKFFEKYATSGKEGGTGIGTYSAQLLVKAQNGSLELEVDDDANSTTLIIVLPAA